MSNPSAILAWSLALVLTAPAVQASPQLLLTWGAEGTGAGQFRFPHSVAVTNDGSVLVSDVINGRLQKFTGEGAENGASRISVFTSEGVYLKRWGGPGSGDGQMIYLSDLAVDAEGNVYAGDQGNHRVQKFSSDGVFLGAWGTYGTGPGQFDQPALVDVGPDGDVYVADTNCRVQRFSPSGVFREEFGSCGSGAGQFQGLGGLAVNASGQVYATDIGGNRVHKFADPETPVRKRTWGEVKAAYK